LQRSAGQPEQRDNRQQGRQPRFSQACDDPVRSVCANRRLVTLAGWFSNSPRLTDWLGSGIAMFANTALAAICAGAAILLATTSSAWAKNVVRFLGTIVFLIGGTTLFQHITGTSLTIDTMLVREPWGLKAADVPGRMGLPASTCFTLIGIDLVLLPPTGARAGRTGRGHFRRHHFDALTDRLSAT
jgi:hypothetical protein